MALAVRVVSIVMMIASIVVLIWVYEWAVKNNSAADDEHIRFTVAAGGVLLVLAGPDDGAEPLAQPIGARAQRLVGELFDGTFDPAERNELAHHRPP